MPFLAFPLQLEKSFLARCDEKEAVLQLLRVMAQTPYGSWPGSRHFGVRDIFEDSRNRRDLPDVVRREINAAFEDLGIKHYRVESVTPESKPTDEQQAYSIRLVSTGDGEIISVGI